MERDWIEILIDWFPILLLIAVWAFAIFQGRNAYRGKSGKSHGAMLEEHIIEVRRQNDLLEQVIKDQEQRLQKLEAAASRT